MLIVSIQNEYTNSATLHLFIVSAINNFVAKLITKLLFLQIITQNTFIVPLTELKKLKMSVETLHSEKVKLEKQNAKKPASKTKGKITLKNDSNVSIKNRR